MHNVSVANTARRIIWVSSTPIFFDMLYPPVLLYSLFYDYLEDESLLWEPPERGNTISLLFWVLSMPASFIKTYGFSFVLSMSSPETVRLAPADPIQ